MKLRPRHTPNQIQPGSTRVCFRFAWLPTDVGGFIVWLSRYEVLQAYIVTTYSITLDGQAQEARVGNWITLEKRAV